jgi:tripartite motif-containing protein 71
MTSNRFDFLEISNQSPILPNPGASETDDNVIRFDVPNVDEASQTPTTRIASPGGMEEEVVYKGRSMRVMEVFGSRGTVAGAFSFPSGIAIDRIGNLFIADSYNHRLQRITPDGGVSILGSRGNGRGQFVAPMGVAVDEDRAFYVIEQGNNRLQKFNADGIYEFSIGREGSKPGEFRGPTGVAVAQGTKMIYIADTGNCRVQVFSGSGLYRGQLGGGGSVRPRITNPQAVACDGLGNVFVADTYANRIMQFDPGGRFIAAFGGGSTPENRLPELTLSEPHALGFDERGRLYITDGLQSQGRVTAIEPETPKICTILDNVGRGLGHLARPGGITAASVRQSKVEPGAERGDIYVSDTMNHRILRFVWS